MIEKTAVHSEDNDDIFIVVTTNQFDQIGHHIDDCMAVIAVLFAAPKNRIDNLPIPDYLQRLKTQNLLIGRLNSVPLFRLIVVHNHRVNRQIDDCRLLNFQSPNEQTLQNLPEDAT